MHEPVLIIKEIPEKRRIKLGITPNLVRFSVGLEDFDDIVSDLETSLDAMK